MKSFEFDEWDDGRLTVNREFADILRCNHLTTFDALMNFEGGDVAKNLLKERITTRITLPDRNGNNQAFYIKRHEPAPWKEYLKPLLRWTRPILGARNEWNAIILFHRAGIETMIPVALGKKGKQSFLLTESLENCRKLSLLLEGYEAHKGNGHAEPRRRLIDAVAGLARKMHAAGMHHQDFYLTHLMIPEDTTNGPLYVIDLGRVRKHKHLSRRWIVKDLAQLQYSARWIAEDDRRQFLESYLDRPLTAGDRDLAQRINQKSLAIARHSRKHRL